MSNDPVPPGEAMPPADRAPRRARLQAAMVLVTVSLASLLAGAALDRWYLHERRGPPRRSAPPGEGRMPREARRSVSEVMARDLALTDAQRAQVDSIIRLQSAEMRAIMEEGRPRVDSVLLRTRAAIARVLTDDQRARFDSLVKARERDAPWMRRRRGSPGGRPGDGGRGIAPPPNDSGRGGASRP